MVSIHEEGRGIAFMSGLGEQTQAPLRVAVLGAGYWGPNLIRNFRENVACRLLAVCDRSPERLKRLQASLPPEVSLLSEATALWRDETIEAVAIATEIGSHYQLASEALEAGKHVFVEKPLAATVRQCQELGELARRANRTLMVGHTFLYNPAVLALKDIATSGRLGDLYYMHAQRLNLGRVQTGVNALWSLAVHDIAIALFVFEELPCQVRCWGHAFLTSQVEDVAFVSLQFPSGRLAHLHASWLDPEKKRQVTLVGSKQMAIYDDVSLDRKLTLYDKGVDKVLKDTAHPEYATFGEFQLLTRSGDVHVPHLVFTEPLKIEVAHFIDCAQGRLKNPLTGWREGAQVVQILECAQRSLEQGGLSIQPDWQGFATPSATQAVDDIRPALPPVDEFLSRR
jgi:predicted dehydrogenase